MTKLSEIHIEWDAENLKWSDRDDYSFSPILGSCYSDENRIIIYIRGILLGIGTFLRGFKEREGTIFYRYDEYDNYTTSIDCCGSSILKEFCDNSIENILSSHSDTIVKLIICEITNTIVHELIHILIGDELNREYRVAFLAELILGNYISREDRFIKEALQDIYQVKIPLGLPNLDSCGIMIQMSSGTINFISQRCVEEWCFRLSHPHSLAGQSGRVVRIPLVRSMIA